MYIFLGVILLLVIAVFLFVQTPKFGRVPAGERLRRLQQSPHYQNGTFQNVMPTPDLTEGVTYPQLFKEILFDPKVRVSPEHPIPSTKTDLHQLDPSADVLVWFGHSSYFLQADGKKILVDPVFSGAASPLPFSIRSFAGTDNYTVRDLPAIDLLLITHDHWDHLDYPTVKALQPTVGLVICGLGIGAHLERWGYRPDQIVEKDWNETVVLPDGFTVHTTTARHFSGRGLARNKALWLSFVLETPTLRLFIGGDSGYGDHFAEIGAKFGSFDLAILENGQYDHKWKYIHMLPHELLRAAGELNARRVLPVHSGKFALASHPWDEPLRQVKAHNETAKMNVITPMIGEEVRLKDPNQAFSAWWENIAPNK